MKFRIVLPDGNAHKLESQADSVIQLAAEITEKFNLVPRSFSLHYLDDEFNDYFTLNNDNDIRDLMSLKVVPVINVDISSQSTSNQSTSLPSCSDNADDDSSQATTSASSSRQKNIKTQYVLVKFDADIEMMLNKATTIFSDSGKTTALTHGVKSRILTRLCADVYEHYTAYPSASDLELVAKTFVLKYPGVKDSGKGYEGWTNSLVFKMGNYRAEMRKRGALEMTVHSGKRSRYHPELPSARKGFKKAKAGVINWQPEHPNGEDQKSLEKHQTDMISELKKGKPDDSLVSKKMSLTFSLRRQQINTNMRISEVISNWPGLLHMKALEMEFYRITNISIRKSFYSKLDSSLDSLSSILKSRGGASGRKISQEFLKCDKDPGNNMLYRDTILRALVLYFGSDISILCPDEECNMDELIPVHIQSSNDAFVVKIDGCNITSHLHLTEAILALFICHYVFNLEYEKSFKLFYLFVQSFLIELPLTGATPAKLVTLTTSLERCNKRKNQ